MKESSCIGMEELFPMVLPLEWEDPFMVPIEPLNADLFHSFISFPFMVPWGFILPSGKEAEEGA